MPVFFNFEGSVDIAEIWRFLIQNMVVRYPIFELLKILSVDCVQSGLTRHPAKFCCISWMLA